MNNKLDAFNKDKIKCKKCKEYYETTIPFFRLIPESNRNWVESSTGLCEYCNKKWVQFWQLATPRMARQSWDGEKIWSDFLNEKQT